MRDDRAMTISSQATATIAPPEWAFGFTHATVLMSGRFLMRSAMAIELVTSPPGVSRSKMISSTPFFSASTIRRRIDSTITSVISPSRWIMAAFAVDVVAGSDSTEAT